MGRFITDKNYNFYEATSSLDSLTEREITKTIQDIIKARLNLMVVLIAHRLSTIIHSDKIYVLERGKIIEQGKHKDLIRKKGLYYALWREQSAIDIEKSINGKNKKN